MNGRLSALERMGRRALLNAIFVSAKRAELVDSNPAERAERRKPPRRKWRILEPQEIVRVASAFVDEQARAVFWTFVFTGMRRSELQQLRWRDVSFSERRLYVRQSKTEQGEDRAITLRPTLLAELEAQYQRTAFKGDGEFVFCHPTRGSRYHETVWAKAFKAALARPESPTTCGRVTTCGIRA